MQGVEIEIGLQDRWRVLGLGENLARRRHDDGPAHILQVRIRAHTIDADDICLVFDRSGDQQRSPMRLPGAGPTGADSEYFGPGPGGNPP